MFLGKPGSSHLSSGRRILAGIVIVNIISALKIKSGNDVIQLLFGETFSPLLSMPDIGLAVLQLVFVTFIAVLYPLKVAYILRLLMPYQRIGRSMNFIFKISLRNLCVKREGIFFLGQQLHPDSNSYNCVWIFSWNFR